VDPLRTYERSLSMGEFTARREVKLVTTARRLRPRKLHANKILRQLKFQAAHAWPLTWGGQEVKKGVFWAHQRVNQSIQTRVANAVERLVRRAGGTGISIFVTVAVRRYPERDLLESATYRVEGVTRVGKVEATLLGEVTVFQRLSLTQRRALVEGEAIPIDAEAVHASSGEVLTSKLDELVEGLRRGSGGSTGRKPGGSPGGGGTKALRGGKRAGGGRPARGLGPDIGNRTVDGASRGVLDDGTGRGAGERRRDVPPRVKPTRPVPPSGAAVPATKPQLGRVSEGVKLPEKTSLRPTRKLGRAGLGMLADELVTLVVDIVLAEFEARLTAENQAQMSRSWKLNVWPKAEPFLEALFEASRADPTLLPQKSPVYVSFPWYMVTWEQAEDFADAAVWGLRFIVGRPGFVEVFYQVEPDTRPYTYGRNGVMWLSKRAPSPGPVSRRERRQHGVSYYVYQFTTSTLVKHPAVTAMLAELEESRADAKKLWETTLRELDRLARSHGDEEGTILGISVRLGEDDYGDARPLLWRLYEKLWDVYGAVADEARDAVKDLHTQCGVWEESLGKRYARLNEEQRQLLSVYAPHYPPSQRDAAMKEIAEIVEEAFGRP
jgi:hypothetical protein